MVIDLLIRQEMNSLDPTLLFSLSKLDNIEQIYLLQTIISKSTDETFKIDHTLTYLIVLCLKERINSNLFNDFSTALKLTHLPKRKCCFKLCISPSSDNSVIINHIIQILLHGNEHFITNTQTEMYTQHRRRKLREL